ncbi:E3 ubiquitin ligase [Malassezia nana]|uniref:E3 ubiquitin ligase n=1 Tax=Malassezia nana TaxID=180528 RepID=A0AAF0EMM6_9BASI|nr:E3 ubiquitin ligase [Malassezia nana]
MRGDRAGKHKRPRLDAQAEDIESGSEPTEASKTLAAIEGGLICGVFYRLAAIFSVPHALCLGFLLLKNCRSQVTTPPLELWALKGVLQAIRAYHGDVSDSSEIHASLWEGLFDPATFYHVIRDQEDGVLRCGMCSSEILHGQCTNPECGIFYENLSDDDSQFHAEDLQDTSDIASSQEEDAGSLKDFVVNEDEDISEASSDSSIVALSPPGRAAAEPSESPPPVATSGSRSHRQERLQALLAARAQRGRGATSPSDTEEEDRPDEDASFTSEEGYEVVQDSDYDSDENESLDEA